MRIEIEYKSQFEVINILADMEADIFTCNNKSVSVPLYAFKECLLDIIFKWENEMINPDITDAEFYKINITTEDGLFSYVGHGIYPDNFDAFKNLILEVVNG